MIKIINTLKNNKNSLLLIFLHCNSHYIHSPSMSEDVLSTFTEAIWRLNPNWLTFFPYLYLICFQFIVCVYWVWSIALNYQLKGAIH